MTTDEVCLVCNKGNKDTYKHLAHAHLTCVMTEIQEARLDEARRIFAELDKIDWEDGAKQHLQYIRMKKKFGVE